MSSPKHIIRRGRSSGSSDTAGAGDSNSLSVEKRTSKRRIDPATTAEVQAVQVQRPTMIKTDDGETLARVGEWLVTDPDGSVHVLTDQKFRMHTLHQQLAQLLTRSRDRVRRAS